MSRATRLFVLITGLAMLMSACASYTECTGPRCDRSNSNTRLIPPDRLLFHRVEFSDNVSGSPYNIELEADKESRLNYSLTAELLDDVEAQGPIASESAREALSAGKSLEVVFRCSVCNFEDNVQAPQEIRYDPSTLRTNEIVFQFTPIESDAVDNWQPLGTEPGVTLILYENGVRHDQLHIPVAVNSKGGVRIDSLNDSPADKFSNSNARDQRAETNIFKIAQSTDILELPPKPPFEIYSDAQPTLTISIYSGSSASQNIVVEAKLQRPRDKDSARMLETQLASFGISAADLYGKKIEFITAFSSFSDLGAALGETYDALSCLVLRKSSSKSTNPQTPSFRRRSLDRLGDIRCDDWVGIPYRWTPGNPSAEAAANRIFLEGRQLYSDLFGSSASGSELRPIMDALSNISHARIDGFLPGGPIKIRTHSQIHVPFQLIHPYTEEYDRSDARFFGLIFDIIEGKDVGQSYRVPKNVPFYDDTSWSLVFGAYSAGNKKPLAAKNDCDALWNSGDVSDRVSFLACQHYSALMATLSQTGKSTTDEAPAGSGNDFFEKLRMKRQDVNFIWAYTHGKTRYDDVSSLYAPIGVSPRLIFRIADPGDEMARDDVFLPTRLRALASESDDGLVFTSHPLVVLIACETGIPGGGTSGQTFAGKFINAGAFGVITTEAEIHDETADAFGKILMQAFARGDGTPPSSAVLEARRRIYQETEGNLWPLLFHYTGSHGSRFEN